MQHLLPPKSAVIAILKVDAEISCKLLRCQVFKHLGEHSALLNVRFKFFLLLLLFSFVAALTFTIIAAASKISVSCDFLARCKPVGVNN